MVWKSKDGIGTTKGQKVLKNKLEKAIRRSLLEQNVLKWSLAVR